MKVICLLLTTITVYYNNVAYQYPLAHFTSANTEQKANPGTLTLVQDLRENRYLQMGRQEKAGKQHWQTGPTLTPAPVSWDGWSFSHHQYSHSWRLFQVTPPRCEKLHKEGFGALFLKHLWLMSALSSWFVHECQQDW